MKKVHLLSLVAVLFAVVGLGLSLASMNKLLSIKDKTEREAANWSVHFRNLSDPIFTGEVQEITRPFLTNKSTSILPFGVRFLDSQDTVTYKFDVVNDGDMNAVVSSITIPKPTCEGTDQTALEAATKICNNLEFALSYADDTPVNIGDTLNKGDTKKLKLKLRYLGEEMPIERVDISNLAISVLYTQN